MMQLTLSHPPTVNTYWRWNKQGGMRIDKPGRLYRDSVYLAAQEWRSQNKPLEGALAMSILWHPPDRRRRDIDNILKALLDSLAKAHVYLDDSQIVQLAITKAVIAKGGLVRVKIERITDD